MMKTTMTMTTKKTRATRLGASLACLFLILFAAYSARAQNSQNTSRAIEGVVSAGSDAEAVTGAVVLLKDIKTLQIRSYIVEQDGKYRFNGLSSDASYEVRARLNDLASAAKTVSVFDGGPVTVVNLKLSNKPAK